MVNNSSDTSVFSLIVDSNLYVQKLVVYFALESS